MATVDGYTADYMEILSDGNIISGTVNGSGHLILTRRDGSTIDAGNVVGPAGTPGTPGAPGTPGSVLLFWNPAVAYTTNQVVSFAGRYFKALSNNTNKPPSLFSSIWTPLAGAGNNMWAQTDPYFNADLSTTPWEFFWKTGTSTVTRTTTAGEFESDVAGLKIALSASSSQRMYDKEENIVSKGDVISVEVRAKLQAAAAGATLECQLLQNDALNAPAPLSTGLATTTPVEGVSRTLSTTWTTYKFHMVAVDAKPRAAINLIAIQAAGNSSVILIDKVKITKGWNTDLMVPAFVNGWVAYGLPWELPRFSRMNDLVVMQGLAAGGVATTGTTIFNLPLYFRPAADRHFLALGSDADDISTLNIYSDGRVNIRSGGAAFLSLDNVVFKAAA